LQEINNSGYVRTCDSCYHFKSTEEISEGFERKFHKPGTLQNNKFGSVEQELIRTSWTFVIMAINIPHNWYRHIPCYSKLFLNVIELFHWNSYDMFSSIFNTCHIGHQWELPPSRCPFWLFHVSSQSLQIHFGMFVCLFSWRYIPLRSYFHSPVAGLASSCSRFLNHTQRHTTVGRTPLDEWSIRRRDLYLTTHNTQNRPTSMPLVWFEPTISVGEVPHTYALDRAATGTGTFWDKNLK